MLEIQRKKNPNLLGDILWLEFGTTITSFSLIYFNYALIVTNHKKKKKLKYIWKKLGYFFLKEL